MSKQLKLYSDEELKIVQGLELKRAEEVAYEVLTLNDAWCERIEVVGSIRRQRDKINDIDFVVLTDDAKWNTLRQNMINSFNARKVLSGNKIHRFLIPIKEGAVQVDFYRSELSTWGIYILVRTGSAEHNVWLAKYALKNKMQLKYSVGLVDGEGNVLTSKDEKEIFRALGLEWIPPPQREMKGGKPIWQR